MKCLSATNGAMQTTLSPAARSSAVLRCLDVTYKQLKLCTFQFMKRETRQETFFVVSNNYEYKSADFCESNNLTKFV